MNNTTDCTPSSDDFWDYYVCQDVAVNTDGGDHIWQLGLSPPRTEMCDAIDAISILQNGKEAANFALSEIKFNSSRTSATGFFLYDITVRDRNEQVPSLAPTVRCRFSYPKKSPKK